MTEAEIKTELDSVDTEIQALRAGLDFKSTGPGGGSLEVRNVAAKLKELQEYRRSLRRDLWRAQGGNVIGPARLGEDIDLNQDNQDE